MRGVRSTSAAAALSVLALGLTAAGSAAAVRPETSGAHRAPLSIPTLSHWYHGSGTWQLGGHARILVWPNRRAMVRTGRQLAGDLRGEVGRTLPVVALRNGYRRGDIVLRRSDDLARRLGDEGYSFEVSRLVRITAQTMTGVFYGGRTLLQLLHQGSTIRQGFGLDSPRYPERGLMVDASRTTYSTPWVLREIHRLAALKLNVLHLHLTDDQRWAIASKSYPTIVAKHAFSRADIHRILRVAKRNHVMVIPELEMPGHMAAFLSRHPGMELKPAAVAGSSTSQQYLTDKLDITNPKALAAMRRILDEYLPLFPGAYWDMGCDEYLTPAEYAAFPQLATFATTHYGPGATPADVIHAFINSVDRIVRAHHKTLRIWSDQIGGTGVVPVNADVVAEWWSSVSPLGDTVTVSPSTLLNKGHQILNAGWYPNYYTDDLGPVAGRAKLPGVYTDWQVNQFDGQELKNGTVTSKQTVPANSPGLLGATLNIWGPLKESTEQTAAGIEPRLAVLAQKAWGSPLPAPTYAEFARDMRRVGLPH
ncbi:MAG TPA: family 20 glycosylhydrolase [Mycobacteriales bacterium]|nr:family 20 glycosylhydrolase [Mycobacteriales bacterium]